MSSNTHRHSFIHAAAAALVLATVAGCAAGPTATAPPTAGTMGTGTASEGSSFNTGRLSVVVMDQNGRPLDRAQVDVVANGTTHYRTTGVTNRDGMVSFNGVPQSVNVSVSHATGSYSQNFNVPPNGVSEMRMIVDTIEMPEAAAGDAGGDAGGGPF